LILWRDRRINSESFAAFNAGQVSCPVIGAINNTTGRVSTKEAEFNQKYWGKITKEYLKSAKQLAQCPEKFNEIITKAEHYVRIGRRSDVGASLTAGSEVIGERALLMDDSD
jgi:hypothetical protein